MLGGSNAPGFCSISRFLSDERPCGKADHKKLYRIVGSCERNSSRPLFNPGENNEQVISCRRGQKNDDDILNSNQNEITRSQKYAGQLRFQFSGRRISFPNGE